MTSSNPVTELPTQGELNAVYASRRQRLLEELGDGLLILPTAAESLRNGDVHHTFRPSSDLDYLCGFPEPGAILIAWTETVRGKPKVRSELFVRPRNKAAEIWNGKRFGTKGAVRSFGVDEAHDIGQFEKVIADRIARHDRIFLTLGQDEGLDRRVFDIFRKLAFTLRKRAAPAHPVLQDPSPVLARMRCIKDDAEIAFLREAARISAEGHLAAMRAGRPGANEYELQAAMEQVFRSQGSKRNGYDSIVASGPNACILHYHENDRKTRRGDLVLIDAGAEFGGYTADITRTWPVSGHFDDAQKLVYQLVLKAQKAAIRSMQVGKPVDTPHKVTVRTLTRGLIDLGFLKGNVQKLIADQAYREFYMHGTSHYLGRDVHDVGAYELPNGKPARFEPGMVLTVEPGLYFDPSDKEIDSEFRGIGVRIEDDVLVTEDGPEILTDGVPKELKDIERICSADPR